MHTPQPNEIYRHFKGKHYRILTLAKHSETGEMLVIYQALYDDHGVYARPLDMFTSEVDHAKYPDVTQQMRFELVPGVDLTVTADMIPNAESAAAFSQATEQTSEAAVSTSETPVQGAGSEPVPEHRPRPIGLKSAEDLMEEFFDADSCRERINILAAMHSQLTDSMVDTMAAALDTEIKNGDIDDRYYELKSYLATMEKYECTRLR